MPSAIFIGCSTVVGGEREGGVASVLFCIYKLKICSRPKRGRRCRLPSDNVGPGAAFSCNILLLTFWQSLLMLFVLAVVVLQLMLLLLLCRNTVSGCAALVNVRPFCICISISITIYNLQRQPSIGRPPKADTPPLPRRPFALPLLCATLPTAVCCLAAISEL